jgi:hypothetical protein
VQIDGGEFTNFDHAGKLTAKPGSAINE